MNMKLKFVALCVVMVANAHTVQAEQAIDAYELLYDEQEPGTDVYRNRYLVTTAHIRIDEPDVGGGYILFDKQANTIYSVSDASRTILVIKSEAYTRPDILKNIKVEYNKLDDAPTIAGKAVYNYRVTASDGETCMDLQLAQGLLPEVTSMLEHYQKVVASQQSRTLEATPLEYQTPCFLYDQVYNEGRYYDKGLPVQEWHSNGKKKLLSSYKRIKAEAALFSIPEEYLQYSIN